jgi:creatinine amidohydrolase
VTKDTGVGDPRKASPEKGKKYLEAVTGKVGQFFLDVAKSDRNNLYV